MAHAFKIVHGDSDRDSALSNIFSSDLSPLFCTDIGSTGINAFHFLSASDLLEYFALCRKFHRTDCRSSALSEKEIERLSYHLKLLEGEELSEDVEEKGSDIYVVSARYKDTPFISRPVIKRLERRYPRKEEDSYFPDHFIYEMCPGVGDFQKNIINLSKTVASQLEIQKPLIFGFSLKDDGSSVLTEIMPNFGLSRHSVLPTILKLNGVNLKDFLMDVYPIE